MHDIFFVTKHDSTSQYEILKQRFPFIKKVKNFFDINALCLTKFYWVVWDDLIVSEKFNFEHPGQDNTVLTFLNGKTYDGISLIPRNLKISPREIEYRFFVNKQEIDVLASTPAPYQKFKISNFSEYKDALKMSEQNFFWMLTDEFTVDENALDSFHISHNDSYARTQNYGFYGTIDENNHSVSTYLLSKNCEVTKPEIELRQLLNCEVVDMVVSKKNNYEIFNIETYDDYLDALKTSKTEMFWGSSANIDTSNFDFNLFFAYDNLYDRHENHAFIHEVGDKKTYDGLFLFSKRKILTKEEIEKRFPKNRKEWPIVASGPVKYEIFNIETYDGYLDALKTSKTEMFWGVSNNLKIDNNFDFNVYFSYDNEYDRKTNHAFIHRVNGKDYYNGVFLLSKHTTLTKREVEHRFPANKKEWSVVASGPVKYDIFEVETYDDYLDALKTSKTEMFWIIPSDVSLKKDFNFDLYFTHNMTYERSVNHAFLNGKYYDGVFLCTKTSPITKREFLYRFVANKKEHATVASLPKPFDVVFISYQEPNADENYEKLLEKVPNAKRIHGVKGIHQAHIAAAKICKTDMFWIVDGDAIIVDDFNFDYQVPKWDRDAVHVWRSQNPVNDLVYGYGGVKLFPTELTINMDTSKPDMTTSITNKFKTVEKISNVTGFNTDPFNTWKSAFRECCKLSSKVIDRQKNEETDNRLKIWTTVGENKQYGKYALSGARAGMVYGSQNKNNIEKLKKINDYDWLMELFNASNI